MRFFRIALLTTIVIPAPAIAGDEVLFADVPDWVDNSDISDLLEEGGPSDLLNDWQYRIEDGVVYEFIDHAVRIDNPQALMQEGTLSFGWLPDKGDLTVHRLEIYREGEGVLDLVEQGVTFEVIRRERRLEQRLLDGQLTATLAVPGLREDDVLRVAYSISVDDQALGDEVQVVQYLPGDNWQVGSARTIVSWPKDEEMYWRVEDRVQLDEPELRDDYYYIFVDLPLGKWDPIPQDAPSRYQRPNILRVGSFASWQQLSQVMTPHFEAAAQLGDDSAVAIEVEKIMAATDDPMERMVMAVRLVQDEVSYLLDGLDGGNYLPQEAEYTWEMRYGDCKAKSVLLLSMLRKMGIESEVVLVTSRGGDAIPELLPLPAAFDHMIVRAVVGGQEYWLDGTSTATRLSNVSDVPPFFNALPLREGGAELMPMVQRDLAQPQMIIDLSVDHSAGIDFPMLFEMDMHVSGPSGAALQAMVDQDNQDMLRDMARSFNSSDLEGALVTDIALSYDEEAASGTIHFEGVASSMFEWRDGRLQLKIDPGAESINFNPDRARPSWRDIPVATAGPGRQRFDVEVRLPEEGEGFELQGQTEFSGGFANTRLTRKSWVEDGVFFSEAEIFQSLGEIAPEDLPEAKRAARRLENSTEELLTPEEVLWRWDLSPEERAVHAEPIMAAYDAAMAFADEDDFTPLQSRALFQLNIYEYDGALVDFDELIDISPSAWAYTTRSTIHEALGNRAAAIADLEASYDLNPINGTAFSLARVLAYNGQIQLAQELLDSLHIGEEDRIGFADAKATVSGLEGDTEGGLMLIAQEVDDRPQNAEVLNSDCWFRGLFNTALGEALDQCTRAVERAENISYALDSRALVRYRLGNLEAAILDLDEALEISPGLAPSMYLRGVIRLEAGDSEGRDDIEIALRMSPQLAEFYSRHGVAPQN